MTDNRIKAIEWGIRSHSLRFKLGFRRMGKNQRNLTGGLNPSISASREFTLALFPESSIMGNCDLMV